MGTKVWRRWKSVLFHFGVLLAASSAQSMTVHVISSSVPGVSLVSADIADDLERAERAIVVRLRNDGVALGETVHLFATVRRPSGQTKLGYTTPVQIRVEPGHEQIVVAPVRNGSDTDQLWVELVAPQRFGSNRGNVLAQAGGEACPFCDWCKSAAQLLCGDRGVSSFGCSCDAGPCNFTCAGD